MDDYTEEIVHHRRHSLGSLSRTEWENSLSVLDYWLSQSSSLQSQSSASSSQLSQSFYATLSADLLWRRLWIEQQVVRQRQYHNLHYVEEAGHRVLEQWLQLLAQTLPSVILPRAEQVWHSLARRQDVSDWRPESRDNHNDDDNMDSDSSSRLITSWLQLAGAWLDVDHADRAAQLLLAPAAWDLLRQQSLSSSLRHDLETLGQKVVRLTPPTSQTKENLQRRANQSLGWDLCLDDTADATTTTATTTATTTTTTTTATTRLTFEQENLFRQTIQTIEAAGVEDAEMVHNAIAEYEQQQQQQFPIRPEERHQWSQAIFDYYLRINDPTRAGQWLWKMNNHHNNNGDNDDDQQQQQHNSRRLLECWSRQRGDDAKAAAWRMEEVLQQMEETDQQHQTNGRLLLPQDYLWTATMWLTGPHKEGAQKALQIIGRAPAWDTSFLSVVVLAGEQSPESISDLLKRTLQLLEDKWEDILGDSVSIVDRLFRLLAQTTQQQDHARQLLALVVAKDGVVTDQHVQDVVAAHAGATDSDEIAKLFQYFAATPATNGPSLQAFSTGIRILKDMTGQPRKAHLAYVFEAMVEAFVRMKTNDHHHDDTAVQCMADAVSSVVDFYSRIGDAQAVQDVLAQCHDQLSTHEAFVSRQRSPISLDSYKHALSLYTKRGLLEPVRAVFDRLHEARRTTTTGLLVPDADVYYMYMSCLGRQPPKGGPDHLEPCRALLNELIDLYTSTGNEAFLPKDRAFNLLLSGMHQHMKKAGQRQAQSPYGYRDMRDLLDTMIRLKVPMRDSYAFNLTIEAAQHHHHDDDDDDAPIDQVVNELLDLMTKDCGLAPDRHTYVNVLKVCGHARRGGGPNTLALVVQAIGVLHQAGATTPPMYRSALFACRRARGVSARQKQTVVQGLVELCRKDQCWTAEVEQLVQSMS